MNRARYSGSPASLTGLRGFLELIVLTAERDKRLVSFATELRGSEAALQALFSRDGRDTDDMPEFAPLADRCGVLVRRLCDTPARGLEGLSAKAMCVGLRDPATGYDAALHLGSSLADDVFRLFGSPI